MFEYMRAFTHGGSFHADDVFTAAFLKILNPNIKIERGFIVPKNYDGFVFDIGFGEFDHHSEPREERENGIKYAAFGKVWRKYAPLYYSDFVVSSVEKSFIMDLDNSDNTGSYNSMSFIVNCFNPFWNEDSTKEKQDSQFNEIVGYAEIFLRRIIDKYIHVEKGIDFVKEAKAKSQDGVVILEKYVPWDSVLTSEDTKVVIYPSNRGGYNAERLKNSGFEFPSDWWGTQEPKSKAVGLTFCHASGFMCNFETEEDAINAVYTILSDKNI